MGSQSTVITSLDALDAIAADKNFGKTLADAVLDKSLHHPTGDQTVKFNATARRHAIPAGEVIEMHHADYKVLIQTHGNSAKILRKGTLETEAVADTKRYATVVILLDAIHTIGEDQNFGKNLRKAILEKAEEEKLRVYLFTADKHGAESAGRVLDVHYGHEKVVFEMQGNTGTKIASPKL